MTTILAYRDAIYADSRCTDNGTAYSSDKIFHIKGMVVGCSGQVAYITEFRRKLARAKDIFALKPAGKIAMDDDDPEFAALVLHPKHGLLAYGTDFGADKVCALHHAIGSGRKAALAAVALMKRHPAFGGIQPIEAIKAACDADAYSSGPVQWMRMGEFKLRKETV